MVGKYSLDPFDGITDFYGNCYGRQGMMIPNIPIREQDEAEYARAVIRGEESAYADPEFPVLPDDVDCLDPTAKHFCKWQTQTGLCDEPLPMMDGWCVGHKNAWGGGAGSRPRLI